MSTLLGPFRLEKVIGQGGMGAVWRAVHLTQRVPVALKVDLHPPAPESTAAFLHEVQIVAALDHPNVVMVLDHGVVDDEAQRASGGELRRGARWLAMELAGGGTASDLPPRSWADVRHVARGMLDGLAHAHARGVIHRDIKPGNLLLAGDESSVATVPESLLAARVVLSDFGISERRDHTALRTEDSVGTPQFMAPEQIEARFRDQGPWTDLYAVGVLLWRQITGEYPFKGNNAFQIYKQHLYDRPGAFRPAMPVPQGTEELIRSLLGKTPGDRPEFAADVRRAIDALGDAADGDWSPPKPDEVEVPTEAAAPITTTRSYASRTRTRTRPGTPLLDDGRRTNVQLLGAGLALYGLRTVPFVGRDAECDRLWSALIAVRAELRARAVVIRGPSGIGSSRLAEWLATRAHELGAASSLRAVHQPGGRPGEGLVGMLTRELGTDGLDKHELEDRLATRFPDVSFDLRSLARLLAPALYELPAPTGGEARQLVLAVLFELARDRARIVVLEDAYLDVEALQFLDQLLTVQVLKPVPILALVTVRDEALVDHPESAELLEELAEDPAFDELPLGPLDAAGRRALVRGMLGLEGALAQQIEDRTEGNPLFASQLLGSWVEQGVLVPGPRGFQAAGGALPEIPRDLSTIWRARLESALLRRPSTDIEALEVAAALGGTVEHASWVAVCEMLQLPVPHALFDDLLKRHLIHAEDADHREWRFAHGLLREALVERARDEGVWRDHNLAAAVHLRELGRGVRASRLARHLIEAEVWDEAVEPLCDAIADQIDSGDLRSADLIEQLESVLGHLRLPRLHPLRARVEVLKANRHRARGELEAAERHAEEAVADALAEGWQGEAPRALREAARILWARATFDRALSRALEAERGFLAIGDALRAADCSNIVAEIQSATGRYAEATERFLKCIEVFTAEGREFLHQPLLGMAQLEQRRGDADATIAWLGRCRAHAEAHGLQLTIAICANIEGELARAAGDAESAAEHYREAAERYRALESPHFAFPLLNLGILDVMASRHEAAVQRMQPVLVFLQRHPDALIEAYAQMVLMAAHAGLGEREPAVDHLTRLTRYVAQSSLVDPDLAEMAERTGGLMRGQGWSDDARRALRLAEAQYRGADRPEGVARVRAMLQI